VVTGLAPCLSAGGSTASRSLKILSVRELSRVALVGALAILGCTAPTASASPTPTLRPSASPTPSLTPTSEPRGSALLPPVSSRAQYGDIQIALEIPDRPGQPAEDRVWRATPFRPDAAYASRIASALGVTGPGVVGAIPVGGTPGSNGPWRLWFGERVLAVNETSGEVYYFDPSATDGPAPPGPAQRDPADVFRRLLGTFGWQADLEPAPARITAFRGTEVAARAEPVISGPWLGPGFRETAVLFPQYPDPVDPVHLPGPRVYGSDHLALLTSRGRPAEIIHRPIGEVTRGEIYPLITFGQARTELLRSPQRYLHFLSNPTGESLTLSSGDAYHGSAWAGFSGGGGLTRGGQLLVPVWVFTAGGTTASGLPVDAIFIVDAVVPALRAQGVGGTANTSADTLLGLQLSILGGQNRELLTARGAARYFLGAPCEPNLATQEEESASGTMTCGGSTVSFTVRRAFPGLASSIWYLSESHR
jgi:hypothetical protein